ncbi:MAG: DUF3786 domain-containing protein [Deltaproteobacteria bacterium]|nr:DUF3786 domain-containing protein [Deltaproteobacteria bacterium]MBW2018243.1 DUF3786 domain-containing protein [Deltaproteobacteria bacterium]MBW2130798.1 DUF3786 domain-containing protein [Deltaproteobacteria bacterium]MBW2305257.1 DUF3786 domain-containing protein [Deltaproteobacteria bacterium]
MPTGACGINCDVCKLRLLGICSSCGAGRGREAEAKLAAQKRLFGGTCTILECARMNNLDYCIRDCSNFPCQNFALGPYPFSKGFLKMQERRRRDRAPALDHNGRPITVPPEFWETLERRDRTTLLNLTLFEAYPPRALKFRFLREDILVDPETRTLKLFTPSGWEELKDPLLELLTLLYLNHVTALHPMGKDLVGCEDLKEAHYFSGRHRLRVEPLVERYGNDPEGFQEAAEYLGGEAVDMADEAFRLLPFPRVPLYYLLWKGDDEFLPRISILFDRSIETCFSASGIWSLVNLVSFFLLKGPEKSI